MKARVDAFDWASTPLGPMESWPQSLRLAVGICLSSRFPMFVWWGPDLVNLYNDAYVEVLGSKHPHALGRPARESWAEIWDVVGPQADAVMARGEATWNERVLLVMERHGYREDTWFTWSYSPIHDEAGGVGGVFCACYEETPRVIAERERDVLLLQVEHERALLAQAFDRSPSFMATLRGPEHHFEYVNARYVQLLGDRAFIGRPVREVIPEAVGQGFVDILDRVYATGVPFVGNGVPIRLERPGGDNVDAVLDFVYQPVRDAEGNITGVLGHGIDVTDRHRAEARDRFLVAVEAALRALTDPHDITLTCARLLAEHLDADRVAYCDVESDEDTFNLIGDFDRGIGSIVGRYRFADFGAEVLADLRRGVSFVVDDVGSHQPPLGDLSWYQATHIQAVICVPLRKAGRLVAAMAAHQRAPRRWTAAEVELVEHVASRCYESLERARVERTLRDSERSFRDLADSMPQIVFAATRDGVVDYFNRQWYEYTGLSEGDTGVDSWRQVHTPDGLARVQQAWPEAIRTGQPYEIEYPLRRRDGALRWHLGRALPVRDDDGTIVRWYGTNTDIHDRKQIEDALARALGSERTARQEAELASRMKDEFLATLSHELRTPLNAILGWAHMIRTGDADASLYARGTEVIERNARAQAKIIDDLLDMSAIISGKVRLDVEPIDLAALVRSAIETARPAADARGVPLCTELGPLDGAAPRGDPGRLQQVLWNVVSNAIKFTPRDGHVTVSLRRAGDQVELAVADSGQGIAPDFLPHVFDRFRQADATSTRRHGGLGLGLAIVKQLVELHGGSVRADSPGLGGGSTFTVLLPAEPRARVPAVQGDDDRPAAADDVRAVDPADGAALAGARVLVVDDEPDARELIGEVLRRCRAEVVTAGSAAEAVRFAERERFDVVVSDIAMPGEDGYTLIGRLRALPGALGAMPALALTAHARPEDRARALAAGFQHHCAKPIEPAALVAAAARLLRR
jgi:PAS domain S-box-containing protein